MSDLSADSSTDATSKPRLAGSFGISAALTTAFSEDGSLDVGKTAAHAAMALREACSSVTVFGTTGEGASLGGVERRSLLEGLLAAGVRPNSIVAGISASAPGEAVGQIVAARDHGVGTVLLPPPFYFKGVGEAGVFDWYAMVLGGLGGRAVRIILYHIPQVTGVPLSSSLILRLQNAFPDLVYGVKDSAGVWEGTEQLLKLPGLAILVGDERHLARAARLGAAGTISGMANILSPRLAAVLSEGREDAALDDLIDEVVAQPVTAAVKVLVARARGDAGWRRVRPPLEPTPEAAALALGVRLDEFLEQAAA